MTPQAITGDIERLGRGHQQGEVGGKDVRHALSEVQFGLSAGLPTRGLLSRSTYRVRVSTGAWS